MKVLVTTKSQFSLSKDETRRFIATLASSIIEARGDGFPSRTNGLPYMPNEGDTSFWTVDSGNDWKIKFSDTSINTFEVIHRYQINDRSRSNEYSGVNEAVKSLAGFLAYKLSGTVVVE